MLILESFFFRYSRSRNLSFIFFERCQPKAFKLSYVHGPYAPPSTRVRILRLGIRQTVESTLAVSSKGRGESVLAVMRETHGT